MRLFFAAIITTLGFTVVQPNNEAITIYGDEPREIQQNFFNFFDSIGKSNGERSETYRTILEEETRKEKQAFDSMKDGLRSARRQNVNRRRLYDEDGQKDGKAAVLKRAAWDLDGLSSVSASSETESKSVSKDLNATETLNTSEEHPREEASVEDIAAHLDRLQPDFDENDPENPADYSDADDEPFLKKSRHSTRRVTPAKAVKEKAKKTVSEDYSSDDDNGLDEFEDDDGPGDSGSSPKKVRKPKKLAKQKEDSKKQSHGSGERVAPAKAIKKAPEKSVSEDYPNDDDSDLDEYEDDDESGDSDDSPKEERKPKMTAKEKKQLKRRKLVEKWNNLTSDERLERRLANEERRRAWMKAHNATCINMTRPQDKLSSSECWESILAKEERTKLFYEATNQTYVNRSMERLEESRRKRTERIQRDRERMQKWKMYGKKRRGRRPFSRAESQEAVQDSVDEDNRPSRPRARDREGWSDRRGGGRGGYDRSRESGYRGNRRYDSSDERLDDRRSDRNNRYRDDGRRGPSRYNSNRGTGYGRGNDRRSNFRGGDRGRGSGFNRGGRYG